MCLTKMLFNVVTTYSLHYTLCASLSLSLSLSAASDRGDSCDCIVECVTKYFVLCVLTPFSAWCASPQKKKELKVEMMPLEELVMMPLENTYISFLQKNTYERVLSRRLYYYRLPGCSFAFVVSS